MLDSDLHAQYNMGGRGYSGGRVWQEGNTGYPMAGES